MWKLLSLYLLFNKDYRDNDEIFPKWIRWSYFCRIFRRCCWFECCCSRSISFSFWTPFGSSTPSWVWSASRAEERMPSKGLPPSILKFCYWIFVDESATTSGAARFLNRGRGGTQTFSNDSLVTVTYAVHLPLPPKKKMSQQFCANNTTDPCQNMSPIVFLVTTPMATTFASGAFVLYLQGRGSHFGVLQAFGKVHPRSDSSVWRSKCRISCPPRREAERRCGCRQTLLRNGLQFDERKFFKYLQVLPQKILLSSQVQW